MDKSDCSKNEIIQIYRIVATIIVCLLHYQIAFGIQPILGVQGYLMVDFFCILSGYLIAKQYTAHKNNFMIRRFLSLYFVYIIPVVVMAIFNCIITGRSILGIISYFVEHFPELCMADWFFPVKMNPTVPVLWYVPNLFFATFFIWELLNLKNINIIKVCSLLVPVSIYNYFFLTVGHIDVWSLHSKFYLSDGLLRVISGCLLGVFCHIVVKRLSLIPCRAIFKKSIGCVSMFCQIVMFFLIITDKWHIVSGGGGGFLFIFLQAVNIGITFWSELYIKENKVIESLAKLTYPSYAMHFVVYTIMQCTGFTKDTPFFTGSVFTISVLMSSFLLYKLSVILTYKFSRLLT